MSLTARERQALRMIDDGRPGSSVAERLEPDTGTVAQHLAVARREFGARPSAASADLARAQELPI